MMDVLVLTTLLQFKKYLFDSKILLLVHTRIQFTHQMYSEFVPFTSETNLLRFKSSIVTVVQRVEQASDQNILEASSDSFCPQRRTVRPSVRPLAAAFKLPAAPSGCAAEPLSTKLTTLVYLQTKNTNIHVQDSSAVISLQPKSRHVSEDRRTSDTSLLF